MGDQLKKIFFVFMSLLTASLSRGAWASDEATSVSTTAPSFKSYGVAVGLGDPFPGLLGISASYNFTKDLRVKIGYAEVEVTSSVGFNGNNFYSETVKAQTYAVGAQYLFTDWAVRPSVGLHAGYFDVSGKGKFEVSGFDESTAYMYSNFGMDWISGSNYQLATGLNVAFLGGSGAGFYASAGYVF